MGKCIPEYEYCGVHRQHTKANGNSKLNYIHSASCARSTVPCNVYFPFAFACFLCTPCFPSQIHTKLSLKIATGDVGPNSNNRSAVARFTWLCHNRATRENTICTVQDSAQDPQFACHFSVEFTQYSPGRCTGPKMDFANSSPREKRCKLRSEWTWKQQVNHGLVSAGWFCEGFLLGP